MKKTCAVLLAVCAGASVAQAVVVNAPDGSAPWLGFMNVFNRPADGGAFQFASGWGVGDLSASFSPTQLTLTPNSIGDPNSYWYLPSGGPGSAGNKIMEANLYIETVDVLNGQTVNFQGTVLSNTLTSAHVTNAFIRDFAPDFSSFNETLVQLTGTGAFSISLATDPGLGRRVQYGFQTVGVNVWVTDLAPFGNVVIAVPAPASLALVGIGGIFAGRRRR